MRKVKPWGNRAPQQPTDEEAKQRQPPQEDKPVVAAKKLKLYSRSRSELACKVFNDCSSMEAGKNLAHEIASKGLLRGRNAKSKFVCNRRGFTADQLTVLIEELVEAPPLIPPKGGKVGMGTGREL